MINRKPTAGLFLIIFCASMLLVADDRTPGVQTLPATPQQPRDGINHPCPCNRENETPKSDDYNGKNQYGFLLFPINLAPDIVSNTILCYGKGVSLFFEYPDEPAWGVLLLIFAPISGIYHGFPDAVEGYPFWSVYLLRSEIFSPFSRDERK